MNALDAKTLRTLIEDHQRIGEMAAWDTTSGVPQLSQEFCDEWATIQGHRCRLLHPEMYPPKQGGRGDE